MNEPKTHHAACFCGAVQFTLAGEPEAMAYCHCDSCRHWSAGPVSAFTLWQPDSVRVTRGSENITMFNGNPGSGDETVVSERKWCSKCGGHLFTNHPTMVLVDVPAVVIEDFAFEPGFHVHYQESVHPIADGLPKFRDLPQEAGGSGETLPEYPVSGKQLRSSHGHLGLWPRSDSGPTRLSNADRLGLAPGWRSSVSRCARRLGIPVRPSALATTDRYPLIRVNERNRVSVYR